MRKNIVEKGISTPLLLGAVVAALLIIGGFVFWWTQQSEGNSNNKEDERNTEQQLVGEEEQEEEIDTTGLTVEDIVVGEGEEVIPGDVLEVDYVGMLEDGTQFDSSIDRGEPYIFQLGVGQEIPGWDVGIEGMRVGGKRKLTVPPHLGYGEEGAEVIPADTTLIFEIEVLRIIEVKG